MQIPLHSLLTPANYVRYRVTRPGPDGSAGPGSVREVPGFQWHAAHGPELLWGATFRITMDFLKFAFGFRPPEPDGLPWVIGQLGESYLTGERGL